MAERQTLPVLPLRGTVIFPGITVPIGVGRPGTPHAIEAALKGDRLIFTVAQRENVDEPAPEQLYTMGVIGRIGQVQRGLGGVQLLLQGRTGPRCCIITMSTGSSRWTPCRSRRLNRSTRTIQPLPHSTGRSGSGPWNWASARGCPRKCFIRFSTRSPTLGGSPTWWPGYVELPVAEKQALLETLGVEERMRRVLIHVQQQIGLLAAQAEIKSQVQEELGERQREMFLREQLKAIQKELGEDDQNREITELREKLSKLELPKEARVEVDRELGRLERAGRESMEAQVIRTYLDWVAELPWNIRSDDQLDLNRATQILDEDHYGLQDVKDRVLEFLAVGSSRGNWPTRWKSLVNARPRSSRPTRTRPPLRGAGPKEEDRAITDPREAKARAMAKGPILLFIGPPGVGKTSIAKSIARSLGRKYIRAPLAASATRPTSVATAAPMSVPCRAGSSRE